MLLKPKQRFKRNTRNSKGFIFSLEAISCLLILLISINSLMVEDKPTVTREIVYTQSQDMVESCIVKENPNEQCFEKIKLVNPQIEYKEEGEITIKRRIGGETRKINFGYSLN